MSKKQIKQFIFTILALIVCVAGYMVADFYSRMNKEESEKESQKAENEKTKVIFEMETIDDVTGFVYVVDGESLMFLKDEGGNWLNSSDESVDLSEEKIESTMLTNLMYIESSEVIEVPGDLSSYGLDVPTNQIVISKSDGTTHTFIIGAQNEFDTGKYYMMLEGDDNVYVIDSTIPNAFSQTVESLTEEETQE